MKKTEDGPAREEPGRPRAVAARATRRVSEVPLSSERPAPRPEPSRESFTKGTRVRVLAGPFVGKVGVVQEVDGRGGARVMLGLLATHLDVTDLTENVEGRARPRLASSHRKPGA